jgi:hypothetical protein
MRSGPELYAGTEITEAGRGFEPARFVYGNRHSNNLAAVHGARAAPSRRAGCGHRLCLVEPAWEQFHLEVGVTPAGFSERQVEGSTARRSQLTLTAPAPERSLRADGAVARRRPAVDRCSHRAAAASSRCPASACPLVETVRLSGRAGGRAPPPGVLWPSGARPSFVVGPVRVVIVPASPSQSSCIPEPRWGLDDGAIRASRRAPAPKPTAASAPASSAPCRAVRGAGRRQVTR